MLQLLTTISTSGTGYWSDAVKPVDITKLKLFVSEDEDEVWGELRVYFDPKTWDTSKHGLVYTDQPFAGKLKGTLQAIGLVGADIGYSEQGMQGADFISFDVGDQFVASWRKLGHAEQ